MSINMINITYMINVISNTNVISSRNISFHNFHILVCGHII
jgi:hypothetical protein